MQHRAAIGVNPDPDMNWVFPAPKKHAITLSRNIDLMPFLPLFVMVDFAHLRKGGHPGRVDYWHVAPKTLVLNAPEKRPTIANAKLPRLANVLSGPMAHRGTKPGNRSGV
jgi:hypothetical protein